MRQVRADARNMMPNIGASGRTWRMLTCTASMALNKCRECGGQVSSQAKVCPHCGAPQQKGADLLVVALIIAGLFFIAVIVIGIVRGKGDGTGSPPLDDIDVFIDKYGSPDREDSTANDIPRPPIVTRVLIYDTESIRAAYVPDAKVGDGPPYKRWKLIGFQDTRDDHVLKPSEVDQRLKNRKRH